MSSSPNIPDREFEAYLRLLSRFLRLSDRQRDEIRRELRAHLDDAVEAELQSGVTRDEAILRVLNDFGDAAELAARFSSIGRKKRWIMQWSAAAACVGFTTVILSLSFPDGPHGATATEQPQAREQRNAARPAASDAAIDSALQTVIPEISLDSMQLLEFFDYLRDLTKINIHVQWDALAETGVEPQKNISMTLRDVTVERLLRLVCSEMPEAKVDFEIDDGILIVSTRERLSRHLVVAVYDVRDLIGMPPIAHASTGGAATPAPDGPPPRPQARSFVSGGAPDVSNPAAVPQVSCGAAASVEPASNEMLLIATIENVIDPESWQDNGGIATCRMFDGALIVRHSPARQREITKFLADLRSARRATGAAGATR